MNAYKPVSYTHLAETALFEPDGARYTKSLKEAMFRSIQELFQRYCMESGKISKDLAAQIMNLSLIHISWLKRYLLDYENAFILISHDIPFLNEVVNIIYHMENQELNRYVGDYDHFQEVYAVKKAQLEAAYRRQQQEISELKDFVARNKARVSTRNMAMSRQKKLDKMDVIELAAEKPKPEFHFRYGRTPGKMLFEDVYKRQDILGT